MRKGDNDFFKPTGGEEENWGPPFLLDSFRWRGTAGSVDTEQIWYLQSTADPEIWQGGESIYKQKTY